MIEFAKAQFELDSEAPDGATAGEHLRSAERQLARIPPALKRGGDRKKKRPAPVRQEPQPPAELTYLWNWTVALINGCATNGFGPRQITWSELKAWSEMTRTVPAAWEIDAMFRISHARLEIDARKVKKPNG